MNALLALAERQYGIVTRAQAVQCGLTERQVDHRVATGALERVHSGVYRVPGSFRSARQRAMAAVLWCGDDALLSHSTAETLLRVPVVASKQPHVSVPHPIRRRSSLFVLHRTATLVRGDRFVVDGLPCTSATRTIIDLAAELDPETLEHAFDAARRMGLTSKLALERRIGDDRAPASLRELLRVVDARPNESRLKCEPRGSCASTRWRRKRRSTSSAPTGSTSCFRLRRSSVSNATASRRSKRPVGASCMSRGTT